MRLYEPVAWMLGQMNQDEHPTNATQLVQSQGPSSFTSAAVQAGGRPLRTRLIACAVLALAVLLTFWPVLQADFVNLDDGEYVLQNPHVATGLSPGNVAWAFTTSYASNWHPLTWVSHMLDVQLFGRAGWSPRGESAAPSSPIQVALFAVLLRLTGAGASVRSRGAFRAASAACGVGLLDFRAEGRPQHEFLRRFGPTRNTFPLSPRRGTVLLFCFLLWA